MQFKRADHSRDIKDCRLCPSPLSPCPPSSPPMSLTYTSSTATCASSSSLPGPADPAPRSSGSPVTLTGSDLSLAQIAAVARHTPSALRLSPCPRLRAAHDASRRVITSKVEAGLSVYGVSTGFGGSADTRTDDPVALGAALLQHQHAGVLIPSSRSRDALSPGMSSLLLVPCAPHPQQHHCRSPIRRTPPRCPRPGPVPPCSSAPTPFYGATLACGGNSSKRWSTSSKRESYLSFPSVGASPPVAVSAYLSRFTPIIAYHVPRPFVPFLHRWHAYWEPCHPRMVARFPKSSDSRSSKCSHATIPCSFLCLYIWRSYSRHRFGWRFPHFPEHSRVLCA